MQNITNFHGVGQLISRYIMEPYCFTQAEALLKMKAPSAKCNEMIQLEQRLKSSHQAAYDDFLAVAGSTDDHEVTSNASA